MNELIQLSDQEFATIQKTVYEAAGIAIADSKRRLLSGRVRQRLKALSLDSFAAYLKFLASDRTGVELIALLDVVSTNETSFFRTQTHFDWFENTFLPEQSELLNESNGPKRLTIWSAASSTGEEAYTLAMLLYRNRDKFRGVEMRILGSDISTSVVERARIARYNNDAVNKLPEEFKQYFEAKDGGMQVIEPVKKLVDFQTHNLMKPAPLNRLDCVFVRNVLIYFDRKSKASVIEAVIKCLRPGGYLVVGPSEGILEVPDGLARRQPFLFQRV